MYDCFGWRAITTYIACVQCFLLASKALPANGKKTYINNPVNWMYSKTNQGFHTMEKLLENAKQNSHRCNAYTQRLAVIAEALLHLAEAPTQDNFILGKLVQPNQPLALQ